MSLLEEKERPNVVSKVDVHNVVKVMEDAFDDIT